MTALLGHDPAGGVLDVHAEALAPMRKLRRLWHELGLDGPVYRQLWKSLGLWDVEPDQHPT